MLQLMVNEVINYYNIIRERESRILSTCLLYDSNATINVFYNLVWGLYSVLKIFWWVQKL